jgi:hypothetical protein
MTRLIRPVLGLALAAAVTATSAAAEPDRLLPADTDIVLSVNVRQALGSDLVKEYALGNLKQVLDGGDVQQLLKELGLDPLKDIDRVVVGASGKDETDLKTLAIVRGRFNAEKLYRAAEAQTRTDPDHFTMIKDGRDVLFKYTPDDGNPVYATVLDEKTIVASIEKKSVTDALAVPPKGKAALNKEMAAVVAKMDDTATLWAAALPNGRLDALKLKGPAAAPGLQNQIANLQSAAVVVRVDKDVDLAISLGMKDAGSAAEAGKTVGELVQTARGALPFLAANNPNLRPLVESAKTLKTEVNDRTIVVTGRLSGQAIGKLIAPEGR